MHLSAVPRFVVGLALYLLLSCSGPLGTTGLLFTPGAMVLVQFFLATPIVTALLIERSRPPGANMAAP
jgi:tungstate transport system permease protein